MVLSPIARDALHWVKENFKIPNDIDYEHEYAYYAPDPDLEFEQCVMILRTDDPTFYVLVLFQDVMDSWERLLLRAYERDGPRRREIRDVLLRHSDVMEALDKLFLTHRGWEADKMLLSHANIQDLQI